MKLVYNELFVEETFTEKQQVTNSVPDSKYVAVPICLEVLKHEIHSSGVSCTQNSSSSLCTPEFLVKRLNFCPQNQRGRASNRGPAVSAN